MVTPPSHTELEELLASLPLFAGITPELRKRVAAETRIRTISARALLFRQGEPCDGLFVVVKGKIRIYRATRSGKEQIIHLLGPGRPIAEVPLFDGGPYPANARAEEDSELLFLPTQAFRRLVGKEPELADAVIRELGGRLRRAVQLIEIISLRDVASRVALTLLERARALTRGDPTSSFPLPDNQARMGERLATTREGVARALRLLADEGLIERDGSLVRIPDPDLLEEWVWER